MRGTQIALFTSRIINVIDDAIGVRFKSLPVTSEKVIEDLCEKEKK